jgi:hypothetical protein
MIRFQIGTTTGETLTLEFDSDPARMSADELFAIAEAANLTDDEAVGDAMDVLAGVLDTGKMTRRALRVTLTTAWVAYRRAGNDVMLADFLRQVAPATLRQLDDTPLTGDAGATRPSPTRKKPKGRAEK